MVHVWEGINEYKGKEGTYQSKIIFNFMNFRNKTDFFLNYYYSYITKFPKLIAILCMTFENYHGGNKFKFKLKQTFV